MVPEANADDERSAVLDAIIGGIAGVILSFIPFSPVVGGGIAGYLQNGTREEGLKVGAGAGLVMLLPYVFIGFFLLMLLGFGGTPAAFGVLALMVLVMASLYTVGLSALGGYLGVYVRQEL
jgi:hypothetical protein